MEKDPVKKVLKRLKGYPTMMSLSDVTAVTGIKRGTLNKRISSHLLPSTYDGYRHYIHRSVVGDIILRNRSAILGWKRRVDLAEELGVKTAAIGWLCTRDELDIETDWYGEVRLSPKEEEYLRRVVPDYAAKETIVRDSTTYYSVNRTAEDAALRLYPRSNRRFAAEKERLYKCYYQWITEERLEHIKVSGVTKHYVPEHVYKYLTSVLRTVDCARLCGVTSELIHNIWTKAGLEKDRLLSAPRIFVRELDRFLLSRLQKRLLARTKDRQERFAVGDITSEVWSRLLRNNSRIKWLDKGDRRAIRFAGEMRREMNSLDAPVPGCDDMPLMDTIAAPVETDSGLDMELVRELLTAEEYRAVAVAYGIEQGDGRIDKDLLEAAVVKLRKGMGHE